MDCLRKLYRRKKEAETISNVHDFTVASISGKSINLSTDESTTIKTWPNLLIDRIKERANQKKMYSLQMSARAKKAWETVNWQDTYELTRTLYMFGDCVYFAAAIAKQFNLKQLHLIPTEINNDTQGKESNDPSHSVAEYRRDVYLDFDGPHNRSELENKYCSENSSSIVFKSEAELRIIAGVDPVQKQLAIDVLKELINQEKWKLPQ